MPNVIDVALSVDALGPQLTGIGRYSLELARGLRKASDVRRVSFFRGEQWIDDPDLMMTEGWHHPKGRLRREFAHWRGRFGARKAIVHGPNYFLPAWASEGVITVHDLSVLLYPETHPIERVKDFELRFKDSLSRSRLIITDSNTVRQEVIDTLGIEPGRVFSVPLGVDMPSETDLQDSALHARYGLTPGSYTLCVSTFEPRKRIGQLVTAYEDLPQGLRHQYPLVLVGARGWLNETLHDQIDRAENAGWLKRLDFVADQTRNALYRGARLFVYPSLYEGFGLPPLEAMAHGIPTIIGDAATLVEITKGAAHVACVDDCEGFAEGIAKLLQDETLRSAAASSAYEVASGYSWPRCVENTVSVYKRLVTS